MKPLMTYDEYLQNPQPCVICALGEFSRLWPDCEKFLLAVSLTVSDAFDPVDRTGPHWGFSEAAQFDREGVAAARADAVEFARKRLMCHAYRHVGRGDLPEFELRVVWAQELDELPKDIDPTPFPIPEFKPKSPIQSVFGWTYPSTLDELDETDEASG